jgi:hypothetical protein
VEPISFGELYSQLLTHENRLDLQNGGQQHSVPSVNNVSRGRGGPSRGRGGHSTGTRGGSNGGGRGRGYFFNKSWNRFTLCQLCGRTNHAVFQCYKRFDPNYMGEEKNANVATSYGVDSNWYANSGATDHVTGELDKLAMKDNYTGGN